MPSQFPEKSPYSLSTNNKFLSIKLHERDSNNFYNSFDNKNIPPIASPNSPVQNSTTLIKAARWSNTTSETDELHPADLRKFLSEDRVKNDSTLSKPSTPTKFKSNAHIQYFVSRHQHNTAMRGALVDTGAKGGMAGDDLKIIATSDRKVDVSGIDNHKLTGLKIVTAGGVVKSQRGKIIVIFINLHMYLGAKASFRVHSWNHLVLSLMTNPRYSKGENNASQLWKAMSSR